MGGKRCGEGKVVSWMSGGWALPCPPEGYRNGYQRCPNGSELLYFFIYANTKVYTKFYRVNDKVTSPKAGQCLYPITTKPKCIMIEFFCLGIQIVRSCLICAIIYKPFSSTHERTGIGYIFAERDCSIDWPRSLACEFSEL